MYSANPAAWTEPWDYRELTGTADLLAFGSAGELICILVKTGPDVVGIQWGPLELLTVVDQFKEARATIESDLVNVVKQRCELGLLPSAAQSRVEGGIKRVRGILLVAVPNMRSMVSVRLGEMFALHPETVVPITEVWRYEDPGIMPMTIKRRR